MSLCKSIYLICNIYIYVYYIIKKCLLVIENNYVNTTPLTGADLDPNPTR